MNNLTKQEELKITRVISTIAVVLIIIMGGLTWHNYKQSKKMVNQYNAKVAAVSKISKYNNEVDQKNTYNSAKSGAAETMKNDAYFINKFYNWNSWEEYTENMKLLRDKFPNIAKEKVVDVTGMAVGNGSSPMNKANYNAYLTPKRGEVINIINQSSQFVSSASTTTWFVKTQMENNKYSIESAHKYNPL